MPGRRDVEQQVPRTKARIWIRDATTGQLYLRRGCGRARGQSNKPAYSAYTWPVKLRWGRVSDKEPGGTEQRRRLQVTRR